MTALERLEAAIALVESEHLLAPTGRLHGPVLAVLRAVYGAHLIEENWHTLVYTEAALELADAILGGD